MNQAQGNDGVELVSVSHPPGTYGQLRGDDNYGQPRGADISPMTDPGGHEAATETDQTADSEGTAFDPFDLRISDLWGTSEEHRRSVRPRPGAVTDESARRGEPAREAFGAPGPMSRRR